VRLVVARCTVDYQGRLAAHLPSAVRLVMVKADGCVAVHGDGGAYKPLNWMNAPNRLRIEQVPAEAGGKAHDRAACGPQSHPGDAAEDSTGDPGASQTQDAAEDPAASQAKGAPGSTPAGQAGEQDSSDAGLWTGTWTVTNPKGETLSIVFHEVFSDSSFEMGIDPGLRKDGVEAHLQALLAENPAVIADGLRLMRREYPTDIGPVDLMCRDAEGNAVAVEVKRRGEIDGVEQLSRYLDFLNGDPRLRPVRGVLVAQEIKPQARVLARSRRIDWVEVDYDELRGIETPDLRLF